MTSTISKALEITMEVLVSSLLIGMAGLGTALMVGAWLSMVILIIRAFTG